MFDIGFISAPRIEHNELSQRGRITLGTFWEVFVAPIGFWQAPDYERQWHEAAQRLTGGEERSGFFTTMYAPSTARFLNWWPMWRLGSQVRVQNQLLFLEQLEGGFDSEDPYRHVGEWEELSEGGQPVSAWLLEVEDLAAFLQRCTDGESRAV